MNELIQPTTEKEKKREDEEQNLDENILNDIKIYDQQRRLLQIIKNDEIRFNSRPY